MAKLPRTLKEAQDRLSRGRSRPASIFDASGVISRAQRLQRSHWMRAHGESPFKVNLPDLPRTKRRYAVVHREASPGEYEWRISWFDGRGAAGHSYVRTYEDALARLQREEGVDLSDIPLRDILPANW